MKRRGLNRLNKRRSNRLHHSRIEHLEARTLLSADLWHNLETLPANDSGNTQSFAYATSYDSLGLDIAGLEALLANAPREFTTNDGLVIELPRPDGTFERFEVFQSKLMADELAARLPDIRTYYGQSIDNPDSTVALDVTPIGFHAQVIGSTGTYLIDPYYYGERDLYASYFGSDAIGNVTSLGDDIHHGDDGDSDHNGGEDATSTFEALVNSASDTAAAALGETSEFPSGSILRTYRVAIAATGEFTEYLGSTASVEAAIMTALNRVNMVYRRDLAINLELIADNYRLIYDDPATDPYPAADGSGANMLQPNQDNVEDEIGAANYDLAQVFAFDPVVGTYGVARLGSVGDDDIKAMSVVATDDPLSPYFAMVSAHEFGHNFSASHTWASCRGPGSGPEIGAGVTIMGYPPICGADSYVTEFTPYFHAVSMDQIIDFVNNTISNVGTRTPTGNSVPTVDAGPNYTIPANTPFVLTAQGQDVEGQELTYSWDQVDFGSAPLSAGDVGFGPLFRYYAPTTDNTRTFPQLESIINNTTPVAEYLPSTDRQINFEVTVRANSPAYGAYNSDSVSLNVVDTGAPFQTTAPMPGETLTGGQLYTFTWDVAGTDTGAINTQNVRIAMSTDGGYTYPHVVTDATPNDGTEVLYVPNEASDTVRFRVEAVGNIFFDITNGNLTVLRGTDPPNTGGGSAGNPVVDSCGVPLPDGTVSFAGAIGGNFFASNHAILDGTEPGMLGYDDVILDFLRGKGTTAEIAKSNYSIAVVGNGMTDWSFTNGSKTASGYERTDYYNINYITSSVFNDLMSHDLIIVLSGESAVAGGMTSDEMELWSTVEENIAEAVNDLGLDLWVGASGGDDSYYDFLPTGALETSSFSTDDPLDAFEVTTEGAVLGLTDAMVDSAGATEHFSDFDNDLFFIERRYLQEFVSVAGQGIAFYNDEIVDRTEVPGGQTTGMVGLAFQDLNMNGVHDVGEDGVAGAKFFIDYNGDGILGLCEPTAVSDALGRFQLRSGYSGNYRILPVPSAGTVVTTTNPVEIELATDGTATLSAPMNFGVISGSDSGNNGMPGSAPVAPGAYLGASPILDDGVIFSHGINKGTNTVTIISNVMNTNTVLNAWIDLNKDGDWDDAGERIFTNVRLQPGQHEYTFTIPTTVFDDSVMPDFARLASTARFRVGPTLGIGAEANDAFGEIEDYKVFITQEADSGLTAKNDVFEYQEDTEGQVFNVLANDSSFYNRTLSIVPGSITNISPVTDPPLAITVSPDGTRILFDATGVLDLTEDITFEYLVQDTAGNIESATVTLVAPIDPTDDGTGGTGTGAIIMPFNNTVTKKTDINNDGLVTSSDMVKLVAELRGTGSRDLPEWSFTPKNFNAYIDVNGDGRFSMLDLLSFLDAFTNRSSTEGEALEAEPSAAVESTSELISAVENVEVVAPIAKQETSSPTVSSSNVYLGWQSIDSDSIGKQQSTAEQADTSVVVDEAFSDTGSFELLDNGQDDLVLSVDSESSEYEFDSSRAEDEIFGDEQWDDELLAF
ncbi:reprolysin-like metallopeptidase [Blastopirellula marina]|uniref:Peptidase M12B domain-containing protein n=1 Tax=Blastopirellula marina TaxID=124 RepID=A0A2S8GVT4_9BACT|nr:zinc-dependent metalloprotease family protein [Blastopirellula marina]PQO48154.1 hypothetical protein C5Y93_00285 [Blastopirellula marina]